MPKIHIGRKIKEVLGKTPLSVIAFAKKINVTRDAAYKIFEKEAITTDQLQKIGQVLEHNFFDYYKTEEQANLTKDPEPKYGFATKEDISIISNAVKALAEQVEKLTERLPKGKPLIKKKYSKK